MGKYKITDPQSGKSVLVTGDTPPTQDDVEEIFGRSRQQKPQLPTNTERLISNLQTPFQKILPNNPIMQGIGKTLDLPMGIPATIANGMAKAGQAKSVPEFASGITQAGAGITALPIAPFVSGMSALSGVPVIGNMMNKVSTPVQSLTQPTSETGKNIASTADNILQMVMARQKPQAEQLISNAPKAISQNINSGKIAKSQAEIKRVAPPTAKELNYDQHLQKATPYIAEEAKITKIDPNVSPIRQATEVVANAKERLWNEKIAPAIESNKNVMVDGGEVANAIRSSISEYTKKHDPNSVSALEDYARTFELYDQQGKKTGNVQIPIGDLNNYVTELNARTNAFQKSTPDVQALTENARPKIKGEVVAVDKMRELLYDKLDETGNPEIRGLKKDYGSLMQIHKALQRNIVKTERGSQSSSFYGKPFGTAVAVGSTLHALQSNPKVAIPAMVIGTIRKYTLDRNKPQPTIERAFNRLAKTK